jgi:hypothetical protein
VAASSSDLPESVPARSVSAGKQTCTALFWFTSSVVRGSVTAQSNGGLAPPRSIGITGRKPLEILCSSNFYSSEAPTCRAQLRNVTLGDGAPMLTREALGDETCKNFLNIKMPCERGIGDTNIGCSEFGPHIRRKTSGTNPGKASDVRCMAARTKFNHLVIQEMAEGPDKRPQVRKANGMPLAS